MRVRFGQTTEQPDSDTFEQLHDGLGIRADQEAEWNRLVKRIELCNALLTDDIVGRCLAEEPGLMAGLHLEFECLNVRLKAIAALVPALKRFYAILSPRQRTRADWMLQSHCDLISPERRIYPTFVSFS